MEKFSHLRRLVAQDGDVGVIFDDRESEGVDRFRPVVGVLVDGLLVKISRKL